MKLDYNAHVTAARVMYETWYPYIDGQTCIVHGKGTKGLPFVFGWAHVVTMIGTN